jgi:uncharacterized protein
MNTISDHAPRVRTDRRIGEVDALRGFALFGILITNVVVAVTGIRSIQGGTFDFTYTFASPVDQAVSAVVDAAFVGKFFVLFSFLFGYSFTLQLGAAARAQTPAAPRLRRRSAALFAIGVVHAALLWFGDILTLYAALGLLLVALRNITPRTAVTAAGCILLAFAALQFLMTSGGGGNAEMPFDVQALEGYRGDPQDTLAAQLTIAPFFAVVIWFTQGPPALAMFLLGLAAGKHRLLEDMPALAQWLPRIQWTGFLVGGSVAIWSVLAAEGAQPPGYVGALTAFTNPLLSAAYVATLLRLTQRPVGARLLAALPPAGMADAAADHAVVPHRAGRAARPARPVGHHRRHRW